MTMVLYFIILYLLNFYLTSKLVNGTETISEFKHIKKIKFIGVIIFISLLILAFFIGHNVLPILLLIYSAFFIFSAYLEYKFMRETRKHYVSILLSLYTIAYAIYIDIDIKIS